MQPVPTSLARGTGLDYVGAPQMETFAPIPAAALPATPPLSAWGEARATLALALPMIAGQLGQMLLQLTDSLLAGRLGVVSLAAASFAVSLTSVCYVVGVGVLTAIAVIAGRAHGAADRAASGETLRHGLWVALGCGLVAGLTLEIAAEHLERFGQTPEVQAAARGFLRALGWSMLPAMLWQALKQWCEAVGAPTAPMWTTFVGVPLNLVLSWGLMFGRAGLPEIGLAGAGVATLTVRSLMAVVLALYVFRSPRLEPEAAGGRWGAWPSWERLRELLTLGLPVGLQLFMEVGLFSSAAIMMGWLGEVPLAAHNIAITCSATTFMLPLGIGLAVSVRIAQVAGAGQPERVRRVGFSALAMGGGVMALSALLFLLAGPWLAGWFVRDAAVIGVAGSLLAVSGVFQIADGLQVVAMSALRGIKDVRVPVGVAFAAYWLLALPGCWLLGFGAGWGAVGVWWGLALGLGAAALLLGWRFARLTRRAGRAVA